MTRIKTGKPLITLDSCGIEAGNEVIIPSLSWEMLEGEAWLVTGPNGGGKSALAAAIAGSLDIVPGAGGTYENAFKGSVALVSFETAASLIEEEKKRDDSDFVEGGIDPGRTVRAFIASALPESEAIRYPGGAGLERNATVASCGIQPIMERGLKYLSTGEIRRSLLCRALLENPSLLILDEPFEGLDTASRAILSRLLDTMAAESLDAPETRLLLVMDRLEGVPASITNVIELAHRRKSFSGTLKDYTRLLAGREDKLREGEEERSASMHADFEKARVQGDQNLSRSIRTKETILVEMKNVTVEWSGKKVLDNLSWKLETGEHWLIRGPNGSGKTTFLELISGDNPQVFRNEVYLFGSRRGSGETIWELKEKMGLVSYRLHLEYRSLGSLSLEDVILSGLHDSIGLYERCGDEERDLARKWLDLAGFEGRGNDCFRELSYGEQRAILIARAAVKCPPLLILDEPCHGLDDDHRSRILELLEAIAESGSSTLLHVTHDPTEALPCERHILELRPGETPMYGIINK